MKNIVIVGAGFGGVRAAKKLLKYLGSDRTINITLVDKHDYHLFYPNLYEVASSEEELTQVSQLKKSVALPLKEIFLGQRITLIQGEVKHIDQASRYVHVASKVLPFDFLITAFGSTTQFYNIPGAEQYGNTLKSLAEALRARNQVGFAVERGSQSITKDYIRVVVAGAGPAGVELVAEYKGMLDILAWKYRYPRHKLELVLVEGATRILPNVSEKAAMKTLSRLQDLGVHVQTNRLINKVDEHFLYFSNGEVLDYDCLVWTAGIKACESCMDNNLEKDKMGRLATSNCLQVGHNQTVFGIGDQASVLDYAGRPLPGTVPQALDQAEYVAHAIVCALKGKKPAPYKCRDFGYFVTVGGKWAVFENGRFVMSGFLAYFLRWLTFTEYFIRTLGIWRGLKLSLMEWRVYSRND